MSLRSKKKKSKKRSKKTEPSERSEQILKNLKKYLFSPSQVEESNNHTLKSDWNKKIVWTDQITFIKTIATWSIPLLVISAPEEIILNLDQTIYEVFDELATHQKLLIPLSNTEFENLMFETAEHESDDDNEENNDENKNEDDYEFEDMLDIMQHTPEIAQEKANEIYPDFSEFWRIFKNSSVVIVSNFNANTRNMNRLHQLFEPYKNLESVTENFQLIITVKSGLIDWQNIPRIFGGVQQYLDLLPGSKYLKIDEFRDEQTRYYSLIDSLFEQLHTKFDAKQAVLFLVGHIISVIGLFAIDWKNLQNRKALFNFFRLEYPLTLFNCVLVVILLKRSTINVYNFHNVWLGFIVVHIWFRWKKLSTYKSLYAIIPLVFGLLLIIAADAINIYNNGWTLDILIFFVIGVIIHSIAVIILKVQKRIT